MTTAPASGTRARALGTARRGAAAAAAAVLRGARSSYAASRVVGTARAERALRRPRPILVYQMGKVGSETVARSLEAAGVAGAGALHLHSLDDEVLTRGEAAYRQRWALVRGASHLWAGRAVARAVRRRPDVRWEVVTLVRDPVARNLSSFFQIGAVELGLTFPETAPGEPLAADDLARLRSWFFERFDEHEVPLRWFDDELAAHLGVDVYAEPFPVERGWAIHEGERARVLVLRLEDLGRVAEEAFTSFLGLRTFALHQANAGAAKAYAATYADFVRRVDLPEPYLDRLYGSRFARHFYSEAERSAFRARWSGRDADPEPPA